MKYFKIFSKTRFNTFIGVIGATCLALCGLPQAIQAIQQGHAEGVSPLFISLWGIGEILTIIYVYNRHRMDLILMANYTLNLAFIGIIAYYMI